MSGILETVKQQTLTYRAMCTKIAEPEKARADLMPPTCNNNIRWHIGHLVWVPWRLTFDLLGQPVPFPAEYGKWFGKGTSPKDWKNGNVPPIDQLLGELTSGTELLFDRIKGHENEKFPTPYGTSVGVILNTPLESLIFSEGHDGIHLGMLMALRRALG